MRERLSGHARPETAGRTEPAEDGGCGTLFDTCQRGADALADVSSLFYRD
ncbi:MAG: hypothetical protein IKH59_01765 [Bacteroidaceae bacterium]|nr:hypothetical protein [Bacteroidaceae bacterium]